METILYINWGNLDHNPLFSLIPVGLLIITLVIKAIISRRRVRKFWNEHWKSVIEKNGYRPIDSKHRDDLRKSICLS